MKSAIAVTREIDDTDLAVRELIQEIGQQGPLPGNKCGILYYDYEMEGDILVEKLQEHFGMEIVGCSVVAAMDGKGGYHDMSAVFTILAASDCEFSIAVSEPLDDANAAEKLVKAFGQARQAVQGDVNLIFALPPCTAIAIDRHLEKFSKAIGDIPIIGGIPSSSGSTGKSVSFKGSFYTDRMALLLMAGNVRPVFSIANVLDAASPRNGVITRAEGNIIYEIDNSMSFASFIESYGFNVTSLVENGDRVFFQKYPLLLTDPSHPAGSQVPYVRVLQTINLENGSGVAFASVPEQAIVSLAVLRKEDIVLSLEKGLGRLLEQIERNNGDGYTYSTVLCVSCAARHMAMTPHHDGEAVRIQELLPDNLRLSGFYSYGELCPTAVIDGNAVNVLHNASIVFCAV